MDVEAFDFDSYQLRASSHESPDDGMCAMEIVSFLAHEPFSDRPACTSSVIGAFVRSLNDNWNDETRQRLKPYLRRMIGTADPSKESLRAWMALDWFCREYTPAWLDLAGIAEEAARIRSLPPILSAEAAIQAMPALNPAKTKAAAAWAAARDAARAAAWDAAWDAAWGAAWAAARAAARDAAWAAAGGAAGAKLQPTVDSLQTSALGLLDRMISVTESSS